MLHRRGPVLRQQFVEPVDDVIVDAGQYISEPSLRIDVFEFYRHDQRGHDRGAISAAFGSGEQPRFSSQCKSAERAFSDLASLLR
jgi:hypothetical protein